MALDFAILAEDGKPAQQLSLSMRLHHELMANASELNLGQILRFSAYYEDVEVMPAELPPLARDIGDLMASTTEAAALSFLAQLNALVASAVAAGQPLQAIAD